MYYEVGYKEGDREGFRIEVLFIYIRDIKNHKFFLYCVIFDNMDPAEEKKIVEEILRNRRLSYSVELVDVEGDKYTLRNNFGSTIVYYKKGDKFYLEEELE